MFVKKKLVFAILCLFIANIFIFYYPVTANASEETIKPLSIDRIHPLHKECLESLYSIMNDSSEMQMNEINSTIAAYNEYLQGKEPSLKVLLTKLKAVDLSISKFIKSNKITDDSSTIPSLEDKYNSLLSIINQLEGNDIRNPFSYNQFCKKDRSFTDCKGMSSTISGNRSSLETAKTLLTKSRSLYTTLKTIQQSVGSKISSIESILKSNSKASTISKQEDKDSLKITNSITNNGFLSTNDFSKLINCFNSFFGTYYANDLDYNNIRFPYYNNDCCNTVNSSGGAQAAENIQIQCTVTPPANYEKDTMYDKLMVNDEFVASKGGGYFPGEYIRLSTAGGGALSAIYSVTIYAEESGSFTKKLFSCSANTLKNIKSYSSTNYSNADGYSFDGTTFIRDMYKFNTSAYSAQKPNYILLSRKAILSVYPCPPKPLRVMVEIRAYDGRETSKYQKEITFVPAYNQGRDISGESLMFIRSKRLSENKRTLREDDFFPIETSAGTPRKGGYIARISNDGNLEYAAYITEVSDKELTILHPDGVTVTKILKRKPVLETSVNTRNADGTISQHVVKINFNYFAYETKSDLCNMLMKEVKTKSISDLPNENTGDEDEDVYKDIFRNGIKLSDGNPISFDTLPSKSDIVNSINIPGIVNFQNYSDKNSNISNVYATAYYNIINKFLSDYAEALSKTSDDIEKEDLYKYLLFNIYNQYDILPATDDNAAYNAAYSKLETSNIAAFLKTIQQAFESENSVDTQSLRTLVSACFPSEVKSLKMQKAAANTTEGNYWFPASGDLIAFDIPKEFVFDNSGIAQSLPYLLKFSAAPDKSVVLYQGFKTENKNTWHYFFSSGYLFEKIDNIIPAQYKSLIKKELEVIGTSNKDLREYRMSDKLFWLLISSSVKTDLSQSLYNRIAVCPVNELGYLRYCDLPYYFYTENSTGDVLPDPAWKDTKANEPIIFANNSLEVNKEVFDLFQNTMSSLVSQDKSLTAVSSPMTYRFRHIDGKTENPLENHAFGIAVDINSKLKPEINTKMTFFENIFGANSRTKIWKYYTDSFQSNGFAFGGYLGTYGPKFIENGHFEVNSLNEYSPKYLQSGMNILNSDISTYYLSIPPTGKDEEFAATIRLYNAPGDFDLLLFNNEDKLVGYSMNGTPSIAEKPQNTLKNRSETIIKALKPGVYKLKIYGYSQKLKHKKYIVDFRLKKKTTDYYKSFSKAAFSDKTTGTYNNNDLLVYDPEAVMGILNPYRNNKNSSENKDSRNYSHIEKYANDATKSNKKLWLWPVSSHYIDTSLDYDTLLHKKYMLSSAWPKYDYLQGKDHSGIDIASPDRGSGILVRAVESGYVCIGDNLATCYYCGQESSQNTITIYHYKDKNFKNKEGVDKHVTTYVHLLKNGVLVNNGDYVEKGDVIGMMGSTGNSTGTHLHFATYYEQAKIPPSGIDPLNKMDINLIGNTFYNLYTNYPTPMQNLINTNYNAKFWIDFYKSRGNSFKIPLHPDYYNISNKVPSVSLQTTNVGIAMDIGTQAETKYVKPRIAVTALIIAEDADTHTEKRSHNHNAYIASVLELRKEIEITDATGQKNNHFSISWPAEKLRDISESNKKYYLRIEVEDLNSGRSWVNEISDVTKYVSK